jgi:hypothetical protein
MLTQLSTLKSRLAILESDTQYDALLTNAIKSVSARFDKETRRTLARTENLTQEFDSVSTEVLATCYPVESVATFETKTSESSGWQTVDPPPDYLIRRSCVISLPVPICYLPSAIAYQSPLTRVTYTGGYLLPGSPQPDPPVPACQNLPDDLEQAAVEQVAYWFQNREHLGLLTIWPHTGTYENFVQSDLLPEIKAVLKRYQRLLL